MKLNSMLKEVFDFKDGVFLNVSELDEIEEAVDLRADDFDWYVMHYDVFNERENEMIKFETFGEALKRFKNEKFLDGNDRIELIFSPVEEDDIFYENLLILIKYQFSIGDKYDV